MNKLVDTYGAKGLAVIGFPCNQFGHQENGKNEDILSMLKHIRPGDGFEPNFDLSVKVEVNGAGEDPLFKWLKASLPMPHDDEECSGARAGETTGNFFCGDASNISWKPVRRSDITWNFEKFLIAPDGSAFRRYSRFYKTEDIAADIETLLAQRE